MYYRMERLSNLLIAIDYSVARLFEMSGPVKLSKAVAKPLSALDKEKRQNEEPKKQTREEWRRKKELEEAINKLGIGPMGLGGKTTVLGVKITMEPCHLASLPLAVNVQCHSQRHEEVVL